MGASMAVQELGMGSRCQDIAEASVALREAEMPPCLPGAAGTG